MAKTKTAGAADPATPDNTPIPGGGSWRWSDALPGWVEATPANAPQPAPTADPKPALE